MNTRFSSPVRGALYLTSLFLVSAVMEFVPNRATAGVVLNEIHYHPVELSAFQTNGLPVLDLSDDVHEFIELYNPGPTNVSLAGWRIAGDVDFAFETNTTIGVGKYVVVARDPARLAAIPQYGLVATNVLGPYSGHLGNGGGTVRLRDTQDQTVDSVSYSSKFPWAIGADALGADDEWTGLNSSSYQYRGRSLERVSVSWNPNDPANWVASPIPGNPSPGKANAVTRTIPKPVVTDFAVYQDSTGASLIRANQSVRIDCTFSANSSLSGVLVEYFVDDINVTNETRLTVTMTANGAAGETRYTALLPGRADRTLVRYRFRANRGTGLETVSPRSDDPFSWHAYFVSPVRGSTNRAFDCFISTASLNTLATNLNPTEPSSVDISVLRRITQPNPPGVPSKTWNATEPAVLVADGVVYDARARYHGSQYRRSPSNNSWKWQFPRYRKLDDREGMFISDNDDITVATGVLYRAGGVPQAYTRWVDFYLNAVPAVRRMDQDEMDDTLMKHFSAERRLASPDLPKEESGEFYKAQGNFLFSDPTGPFGYGGYRILPPLPPYWTELQRYENTYGLQMNGWKGYVPFRDMLHGLWDARGDSPAAVNPNVNNLRAWLTNNFDVDATLTSMAIRVWCGGWDNFNHNTFAWRHENGKWSILQWDFDSELDVGTTNASIYLSEKGAPLIYGGFAGPPAWVDANWINDSFFKGMRNEYRQKLWILNNTLLNPTNITALGLGSFRAYADGRFASVNSQLGLGVFQRPRQPTNVAPGRLQSAFPPANLVSSAYSHTAIPAPAHRSTTWWIRPATGTYDAPVFKGTSLTNLTSFPIPFGQLTFGQTYFWKCQYTDVDGHPSFESAETQFIYGAEPSYAPLIALDDDTSWKFNTNGVALPTTWRTVDFDDSTWSDGQPLIGDDIDPLPEPLRTPIQRGTRLVNYFRKKFVFTGDPSTAILRIRHVVDDGVVVWLNGVEIHRLGVSGLPGSLVGNTTPANRIVTDAVYEGPFVVFPTNLVVGTNVIAASVHRVSSVSPDTVFGFALDVAVPPSPGSVVLNEILADNRGSVTNGASHPDYIELFNNTDTQQALEGLSLSDNVRQPGKFVFPRGAKIAPHGYVVVWCDNETNAPGYHTSFALDNDGQTVALFTIVTNGFVLSDSVTFGLQIPDYAVGRSTDGGGLWRLTVPTPGLPVVAAAMGTASGLKINEWMATDAGGPDWLELFNPGALPIQLAGLALTDDPDVPMASTIPSLSFIAPNGFRQLLADSHPEDGAQHLDFKLSGGGETVVLSDSFGQPIDRIQFGPQLSGVSEGRLPDGSDAIVAFPTTASPGEANYLGVDNLVINEVLAHSEDPFEDAVELANLGDAALDISGWWLSDDRTRPQKYLVPVGTVVPAHGYAVLYEFQFNANPAAPGNFAFDSARGDEVYLSAADGSGALTGYRIGAKFGSSESGVSIGRFNTSEGVKFVALAQRTFGVDDPANIDVFRSGTGAPNATAAVGPIVISEILYHPPDVNGEDNSRDEFIELRNITGNAVPLFLPSAPTNLWRLRDAVDYTFPPNVTLAAGEAVIVVGFDPVADTNAMSAFRDTYGPVSVRIFGPWSGKLDNSSESVELVKPDVPVSVAGPDFGYVPTILVDRVRYTDHFPWPESADGTGFSLMRSTLSGFGDEPLNWFAWFPTPGAENGYNEPPIITVLSPADGTVVTGPTTIPISVDVVDPDGSVNQVEFYDGTNRLARLTAAPYQFAWTGAEFGQHTLTVKARDNRYAATVSAPIHVRVGSIPPVVSLTSPALGASFAASNLVSMTATANDIDTPITDVSFLVDGVRVAKIASAPYLATWSATPGVHVLTAVATDSSGTTGTSTPVTVFVQTVISSESVLIPAGSLWTYLDTGANPGTTWTGLNFLDNTWRIGPAELGYGDGDEFTVLNRLGTAGTVTIAFYFRNKFVLNSASDITSATLWLLRDDGAVAYLNGVEVDRDNMPAGVITFQTLAATAVANQDEVTFFPATISPTRFVTGTNILAVEVHQSGTSSSDVSFDAELRVNRAVYGPKITSHPTNMTVQPGGTAVFSVAATGTATLTYQWLFKGSPLIGQTNAVLNLANVQANQSGQYAVTVSNSIASVTSLPATLTIGGSTLDSDGDGLPDEWELAHGLDPFNGEDRDLDPDLDRMSNWAEYVAGTNPQDGSSVLKFSSIRRGRAIFVTFASAAGQAYTVESRDQLGAGSWQTLSSVAPRLTNGVITVVDPNPGGSRFYRVSAATAPAVPLRVVSIVPAMSTLLSFDAVADRNYVVEKSDQFGTGPWTPLEGIVARPIDRNEVVGDPGNATNRFYRIIVNPPGN